MSETILHTFIIIFCGAAITASLALYTRQPLLVAYIAVGVLLGPFGTGVIPDVSFISQISHIGIIFLLFLLGLDMQPSALIAVLRKATSVALVSCALFGTLGFVIGISTGFTLMESIVISMASMFSSTIIGIKLLPTTILHHRHTGDLMVGLLLIQDFIAIFCLLILLSGEGGGIDAKMLVMALISLPLLSIASFYMVKFVLAKLFMKFDRFHEYIFLLAIGWCLGLAALAEMLHLSAEIGAFIAGVSIATSPISQYIALNLKPLRDFFLILFFFSLGAQLNIQILPQIWWIVLLYATTMLAIKPITFYLLLRQQSEQRILAWDVGFRLGQISEFSLLISFVAVSTGIIGEKSSVLIQSSAIISFIVSSYIVTFNFPNPIAASDKLRRD